MIKAWTKDLASRNEDINWETVWENIFQASKNPNHQLTYSKMCQRAYHTPLVRFHMKRIGRQNCDSCNLNVSGTFKHMMWDCPEVYDFWRKVALILSDIIGKQSSIIKQS